MSATVLMVSDGFEVSAWVDPEIDRFGWRADTDEMLTYAQAILGPTASTIWWRMSRYVIDGQPVLFTPAEFASSFGVMPSMAAKAIDRLVHFGVAHYTQSGFAVRTHVPPFPNRWLDRLPTYLANAYRSADPHQVAA